MFVHANNEKWPNRRRVFLSCCIHHVRRCVNRYASITHTATGESDSPHMAFIISCLAQKSDKMQEFTPVFDE